jgi:hypothetical protein
MGDIYIDFNNPISTISPIYKVKYRSADLDKSKSEYYTCINGRGLNGLCQLYPGATVHIDIYNPDHMKIFSTDEEKEYFLSIIKY